ncbi:hypothetical protein U9M48_039173 [Paspalum notatum var. saurae]|uniref:DRBM domain-containing protein n=1 Tax=Paspalum notatum var. saurae TaxID=547442 RepID=A0AAQ3XB59_PASNO
MATATATSTATTTAATADPSPPNPEKNMHKNRLQSYAARTHKMLPVYSVECEGEYHQPKFRCTVEVGGQQFSSTGSFSRKKEAEQDAARVAYEILVTVGENDVKEMLGMIDQLVHRGAWPPSRHPAPLGCCSPSADTPRPRCPSPSPLHTRDGGEADGRHPGGHGGMRLCLERSERDQRLSEAAVHIGQAEEVVKLQHQRGGATRVWSGGGEGRRGRGVAAVGRQQPRSTGGALGDRDGREAPRWTCLDQNNLPSQQTGVHDGVFSKSILYEFAVKTKTTWPAYSVVRLEKPFTMFVASVVFDGTTYTGDSAPNMKDAKQNAARSVIKSILATGNTCMVEIIRSKKHLITAVRSSGNTSTTFTPIKFTRSVAYTAYGGPDHVEPMSQDGSSSLAVQGHSIPPTVGPSAKPSTKVVTVSKKRKDRIEGPDVNEARVAKEH